MSGSISMSGAMSTFFRNSTKSGADAKSAGPRHENSIGADPAFAAETPGVSSTFLSSSTEAAASDGSQTSLAASTFVAVGFGSSGSTGPGMRSGVASFFRTPRTWSESGDVSGEGTPEPPARRDVPDKRDPSAPCPTWSNSAVIQL
jgi:hypothetical protein